MLKLSSTYLIVKNVEESISFYNKLLQMEPTAQNFNRWIQYDFNGQCIALWNPEYDDIRMASGKDFDDIYSVEYQNYHKSMNLEYGNNVVLNFTCNDLKKEYDRVKTFVKGSITPIMSINVAGPYHMFIVEDPDGNQIEIAGNY